MIFRRSVNCLFILLFFQVFAISSALAIDFLEDESIIWRSGYDLFIYEEIESKKFGLNEHPVDLNQKELENALQSIRIQNEGFFSDNEESEPLFTIQTARRVAEFLVKGLRGAKENQDIFFTVRSQKSRLLILKRKFLTSGRAFFKNGKLNLIVGSYEQAVNDALERELNPGGSGSSITTGTLKKALRTDKFFAFDEQSIKVNGIENFVVGKKTRNDWFVIDVPVASEAWLAELKRLKGPTVDSVADEKLKMEAAKMAKQRREMRAEMARMRKEIQNISNEDSPAGGASAKSIEERIATLDQLLDKQLISKEEYDAKRQDILNDI